MFAVAPIRSADGQIIAALGLRIAPDTDFTRILATARAGQTGDTYAFGRDGKQLSESRFDTDLKRRTELPFTRAVSEALAGHAGVDANGYRDYRGVLVVGAWMWLDDFDMGLVTEVDRAEAFRPLRILRGGFW